jgi:O-acetyl-ADP-ribose deacetylase (regulator of RNase III)
MPSPINVFICHKKTVHSRGSRPALKDGKVQATLLHKILRSYPERYCSWMDEHSISPGMHWESEIYKKLRSSDVVLVAVAPGTSQSEWVRREIALARAFGITILPLGYDLEREELVSELERLAISEIQGGLPKNIKYPPSAAFLKELHTYLEWARSQTRAGRAEVIASLTERQSSDAPKAKDDQWAFELPIELGGSKIFMRVASGDLTTTTGIDILVNSENDYMQMARAFEGRTVSAQLRARGASESGNKYVDTIQNELDFQVGVGMRPVRPAQVFVTSAGGPDSRLARDNRARYIFHVAAVHADVANRQVVPFHQRDQIEDCARACLRKLLELDRKKGVVSPKDTPQYKEQERLAKSGKWMARSILFPLFGTGQGGRPVRDAIKPMLSGIRSFLCDRRTLESARLSRTSISRRGGSRMSRL